jgi:uncharacterized membrane protein YjgN (DUF898 family)
VTTSTAKIHYHGTGGSLFGLMFVNGLLSAITLGIYSFWARTKIRQFHYSNTEIDGDRLTYHGTGGELLVGSLKAGAILFGIGLLWFLATTMLSGPHGSPVAAIAILIGLWAAIGTLMILAVNGARRYRLSRSSFRGIRFSFQGKPTDFALLMLKGIALSVITLGFYGPYFQDARRAFLVNNARFGSEPFIYKSHPGELARQYVRALLLTIPTLGLSWVWYAAFKHRHFWGYTNMRGARFQSAVTGGALLKLQLTNVLLAVFTFGIGVPWVVARTYRFWCENISLHGTVDWATITQAAKGTAASGAEALADGLNVDVGIGM